MMGAPRVLFAYTHLLGVGHVHRAAALARAMADAGLAVHGVHGGVRVPHLAWPGEALHHLPPVAARDASYAETLDGEGRPLGPHWLRRRREALLRVAQAVRPDAILVEAWPFGRRFMAREMLALASAWPGVPLAVSVRDILQARKAGRARETADLVNAHVARVLVHADPAIVRLADTFEEAAAIGPRTVHTGFVAPPAPRAVRDGAPPADVLVSAGGGAFGGDLMRAACAAAALTPDRRWHIVTGPNLDAGERDALAVPPNARLSIRVDALAAHMMAARVTVSQCGYNTAMDTLHAARAGTRTVFVPHDTTGQTEQRRRAEIFARAGRAVCLPQSALTPRGLVAAIETAPDPSGLAMPDMDGAPASARILATLAVRRGPEDPPAGEGR